MKTDYHIHTAKQIVTAISQLSNEAYSTKLPILHNNSCGQHFRHILEFYLCLFEAKNTGIVNYDKRKRDYLIETDRSYALEVSKMIHDELGNIDKKAVLGLETCMGENTEIVSSNYAREMVYLTEHTIHHFALIKIGVTQSFPQVNLEENFGVAQSTITYKAKLL